MLSTNSIGSERKARRAKTARVKVRDEENFDTHNIVTGEREMIFTPVSVHSRLRRHTGDRQCE